MPKEPKIKHQESPKDDTKPKGDKRQKKQASSDFYKKFIKVEKLARETQIMFDMVRTLIQKVEIDSFPAPKPRFIMRSVSNFYSVSTCESDSTKFKPFNTPERGKDHKKCIAVQGSQAGFGKLLSKEI